MSGKDFISPVTLMAAGDMSGDLTSSTVTLMGFDNVGIQFIFTGTPEGTFDVDISLDGTNWTTLPLSPTPEATGAAGNEYVELNQSTAKYLRCRYTATASTGSLKILISQKMV
jgi:hypothetical protein